ncbi:MAG: type VI secretion system baseplate subunit TssF [Polyangiaceae bacterium]|nr:type VI secretion system baseplate subunit TssF [Polyangiaceae bacterium]
MFRDDYMAEVDYLFQLCEELGERYPSLGPMLGRDTDPAIARLVEGLAFSFSRLRQRLDDDLPEVIHPVIDNLCPELLRPTPSATIVELLPMPRMMSSQIVKAESSFAARPVDGVSCTFRSTIDCEVNPWTLRRVEVCAEGRVVRMTFDLFEGAMLGAALPNVLNLFFAMPPAVALEARSFFLRHTTAVTARTEPSGTTVRVAESLPSDTSTGVASSESAAASAFVRLRESFAHPESFAFVRVHGIDAAKQLGRDARTIVFEFTLREPVPRGLDLNTDNVRIHCVPVKNVFRIPSVRVPLDSRTCGQIRIGNDVADGEVFSIERVRVVNRGLQRIDVEPWARFFPPDRGVETNTIRYKVHRCPSVFGPHLDVSLSFEAPSAVPSALSAIDDIVSAEVDILATNGTRAARLGIGDVCVATTTSPAQVAFRNVTPVGRACSPRVDGDSLWGFFRLLRVGLATLADTEYLASVLALANLPAHAEWPDAKPTADRFVPLVRVSKHRAHASASIDVRSGATVRVDVDTKRFSSMGELHLFGELLAVLFASTILEHEWVMLTIADAQGQPLSHYPRYTGKRRGL